MATNGEWATAIIADDLTGACDAASPFSSLGKVTVKCSPLIDALEQCLVLSVSTNTRNESKELIETTLTSLVDRLISEDAPRLLKKVDSTMKGRPGLEIETVLRASQASVALVCPAHPLQGRTVAEGILSVRGQEGKIDLASCLSESTGLPIRIFSQGRLAELLSQQETPLPSSRDAEPELWIIDAASELELDRIVELKNKLGVQAIEVGSAGLTCSVARSLRSQRTESPKDWRFNSASFIAVIGSTNPVTQRQSSALRRKRNAVDLSDSQIIEDSSIGQSSRPYIMTVDRTHESRKRMKTLVRSLTSSVAGTILLSGGDTAKAFCEFANVNSLLILGEFRPSIPVCQVRDGALQDWKFITKAGGFGDEDCLVDLFDCAHSMATRKPQTTN